MVRKGSRVRVPRRALVRGPVAGVFLCSPARSERLEDRRGYQSRVPHPDPARCAHCLRLLEAHRSLSTTMCSSRTPARPSALASRSNCVTRKSALPFSILLMRCLLSPDRLAMASCESLSRVRMTRVTAARPSRNLSVEGEDFARWVIGCLLQLVRVGAVPATADGKVPRRWDRWVPRPPQAPAAGHVMRGQVRGRRRMRESRRLDIVKALTHGGPALRRLSTQLTNAREALRHPRLHMPQDPTGGGLKRSSALGQLDQLTGGDAVQPRVVLEESNGYAVLRHFGAGTRSTQIARRGRRQSGCRRGDGGRTPGDVDHAATLGWCLTVSNPSY
jgi:hypothetical protein